MFCFYLEDVFIWRLSSYNLAFKKWQTKAAVERTAKARHQPKEAVCVGFGGNLQQQRRSRQGHSRVREGSRSIVYCKRNGETRNLVTGEWMTTACDVVPRRVFFLMDASFSARQKSQSQQFCRNQSL